MCIFVKASRKPVVQVATKPITVYKFFDFYENWSVISSPYQDCRYKIGVLKTAKQGFGKSERLYNKTIKEINKIGRSLYETIDLDEGLHSYSTKTCAISHELTPYLFLCRLPVGTRYMKGIGQEILSDQLMVIEQVEF